VSAGAQPVDEIGEPDLPGAPEALGGDDRLHQADAFLDVAVDDDVIVFRPVAHLGGGFGHPRGDHIGAVLGPGLQPGFECGHARRQYEHLDQVVLADAADLQTVAEAIGWGIFYNAGQTCHAGSRVVVQEAVAEELRERLKTVAGTFVPADPASDDTTLGALISSEHLGNVHEHVRRARDDGAAIVFGDDRAPEPVAGGAYMGPTLIDSSDDPARAIVQDEVFGPVLTLQTARDVDHAFAGV